MDEKTRCVRCGSDSVDEDIGVITCHNCGHVEDVFDGLEEFLDDVRGCGTELLTCEDCVDVNWCILHKCYGVLLCEHIEVREADSDG
jgi:hypothetical protein